jgi:nitrite reductase (NADH) small subunit
MFIKIALQSELPANNEVKEIAAGDKTICVANVDGQICALENTCLHMGGPLGEGVIEKGKIVCPWHGWEWDPKTGMGAGPGAKLAVYPVKIEDGEVMMEI